MRRRREICGLICAGLLLLGPALHADDLLDGSFVNFESHQFRPLALSTDGQRLFVANTPANSIEVFALGEAEPRRIASVPVGLEPVAIAARNDAEVWVVNHLSDSVSIVDVAAPVPYVKSTLLVGDEPRDIVFAGPERSKAFVSTAHRGQNGPWSNELNPGQLTTPGVGRADVWVFDANEPEAGAKVTALFGDSPGPLAVSPDGNSVYVGVFKSGNQTTIVGRVLICPGGTEAEPCELLPGGSVAPGGLPAPNASAAGVPMPEAGLIVKWDGTAWKDEVGRDWSDVIRLDLPDYDVFRLDATGNNPAQTAAYSGVGTVLYAMAVNPANGKLFVANTEARNMVRFEGSRPADSTISTVQGRLHETRVSVIDPAENSVTAAHLNPHIDYEQFPVPARVREKSLSMPVAIAFSKDGRSAWIAAKGSDKIAVLDTAKLERGKYRPSTRKQITIPGGGPAGLALDEDRQLLYVLGRFDNTLNVVNIRKRRLEHQVSLYNPEPANIAAGRRLFFNAALTSGNGESSCASCHVSGDKDELAWDLGNPYDDMLPNPAPVIGPLMGTRDFHPMKGPMLTQTMRGITSHGALHWRADRTGGNDPGGNPFDTRAAMKKFNPAFVTLLGRETQLDEAQLELLTDYSLSLMPPPNPIRRLDNSLTPLQASGKNVFETAPTVPRGTCATCHVLNPERGWYGTRGLTTYIIGGRPTKIPSHRNTYERVGMFGRAATRTLKRDDEHMGPQIRGYGFTHDGGADTTIRFMSYPVFRFRNGDKDRRAVEQYLFAFASNLKPIVGQQLTLRQDNHVAARPRAQLLFDRALAGDATLLAHGVFDAGQRCYVLRADGRFSEPGTSGSSRPAAELIEAALAADTALTLTAAPPVPKALDSYCRSY